MFLPVLDTFYTLLHLLIIGFNLFGWIWPATRRVHVYSLLLTAASWLLLGIWYGIGYCPITDWQWAVKTRLGEQNLPNSFIKYQVDKLTGVDSNPTLIDTLTTVCFGAACAMALYINWIGKKSKPNN